MDESQYTRSLTAPNAVLKTPETDEVLEPSFPILDVHELGSELEDLREQLSAEDRALLRPEEVVVHVHRQEIMLPTHPITPIEVVMKAANVSMPEEIGFMGSTVASVDIHGTGERSRYERQHGRDDLIAGEDLKYIHPQLLDTVVASLASTQGTKNEVYFPGTPYGFERPGSIILVDFSPDDPLGQKFQNYKDWAPRFYASVDAPGLFVDAIAHLQSIDPSYVMKREYTATDGSVHKIIRAFDLSVLWLTERMDENPQGLIEYRNPYENGRGMRNQGWKDSADAMVHKNGEWVNSQYGVAPIEVQCQAVTSLRKAAAIYRSVHSNEIAAQQLEARAESLFNFILEQAWVQDERGGYFATGWDRSEDGSLRRIETRSIDMHSVLRILDMSNPDHKAMARETVRTLTSEEMLTRWGSRVMSAKEKAYGHLRYHCGVWPDKSNRVAESMTAIGLYGVDRMLGGLTTNTVTALGCYPEHISGEDSDAPQLPTKDVYVYNTKYRELYLAEQVPPLGQTWGATSEMGKDYRYSQIPFQANAPDDRRFEAEIEATILGRYGKQ